MTKRTLEELRELRKSLAEMVDKGMTQSQMGDQLGMTKNQVSGLVARLLRGYVSRKINKDWKPEVIEEARTKMTGISKPSLPERVEEMPITNSDLSFDPPEGKFNIYNIKPCQCRYLTDDGFFCGEPKSKASYCDYHHNICHVPPSPRKAKTWRNSLPSPSVNFA